MRTQALSVAADAAMLQAITTVAAAVLPPADFQLPKLRKPSRSATPGSSRRPRSLKGPPAMLLSNAIIAFEVRPMPERMLATGCSRVPVRAFPRSSPALQRLPVKEYPCTNLEVPQP